MLPSYQSAYRKGYSTETALVKLSNDILCNMEQQRVTALVCVDLSAAFDTVDHDVLLQVLRNKFGVSGVALTWFESYLRPRSTTVIIEDHQSSPVDVRCSVPQGSICGPVLYTIYASTLKEHIRNYDVSILGYADDHSLYSSFDPNSALNAHDVLQNLEHCLSSVNDWMSLNRLKMNTSKTEFMLFGHRSQLDKCTMDSITVCSDVVHLTSSLKYLGVYFDEFLSFKQHISNKCRIASHNLYCIRQIRQYITLDICHQLVHSLVISHLDYSNAILYGLPASTLAPLQRIQHRAAKLILNRGRYDSATDALRTLHWLPIRYRSLFKIA